MRQKKTIIFIVGPTAVGKTLFGIELAKGISGEIISYDSMQAYRYMDIMSQKPTPRERKTVIHHLIDILDVREEYSAAEFVKRATPLIKRIIEKGRTPIVVGGSGLYIKALIDGIFPAPKKDTDFRKNLESEAKESGKERLYERLKEIDPEAASKIHPNDLRRIIRALEIFHLTGKPISEHKRETRGIKDDFKIKIYGLRRPRAMFYKDIEARVDRMLEKGLVDEAKLIRTKRPGITAECALGYREVLGYLDKRYPLEEAGELIKKNTRHLAKRQMTWFRQDERIRWIDLEKTPRKKLLELVRKDSLG